MLVLAHEWKAELCIHVLASLGSTQPFVVQLQLFLNVAIRAHGIFVHLTISQIVVTAKTTLNRQASPPEIKSRCGQPFEFVEKHFATNRTL